jgi:universal stress protein A
MRQSAIILHPADFSSFSTQAFKVACSLARDHSGRLIILHVAEPPVVADGGVMMAAPPQGDWQALDEQLRRIQPPDPTTPVEYRLEEGDPAAVILRVSEESKCDLIVMGTHGRTWLSHLLMGSVAEKVVRKAKCSVLVVKTPLEERNKT